MTPLIRVLIVDDSAFARKVIREVLSRDLGIEVVGIARDGLEALEKVSELKPDVVTLDLLMPDLDGLGFLCALAKENRPRVLIVSTAGSDSDLAVEALQMGAVDIVTKPTALPTDRLYELSTDLVEKVKAAAIARPRAQAVSADLATVQPSAFLKNENAEARILIIGTSTGGPQALTSLFKSLPKDLPVPVAIALHIPAGYTAPLAERLTKLGSIPVTEARDGMPFKAGEAMIAPGGMHLQIREQNRSFFAHVSYEPVETLHHPSVDVLFESAANAAGAGVVAVVLTGMGSDGSEGSKAIKEKGGRVIAESESSCVVFGMPRCVIENGTATLQAPLERLTALIVDQIVS